MPNPLVSIVIPHHNQARWLARCIDSCIMQTYEHTEIIVVDDASTEDLGPVLQSLGPLIRYVQLCEQKGPASARNHGLSVARGELIQFLDADDVIAPEKLAVQVAALQKSRADVALASWRKVFCLGDLHLPFPVKRMTQIDTLLYDTVADLNGWFPVMCCLFTREILTRVGPWSSDDLVEDRDFRYRLLRLEPQIVVNDECLFSYRRYPVVSRSQRVHFDFDGYSTRYKSDCDFLTKVLQDANDLQKASPKLGHAVAVLTKKLDAFYRHFQHRQRLDTLIQSSKRVGNTSISRNDQRAIARISQEKPGYITRLVLGISDALLPSKSSKTFKITWNHLVPFIRDWRRALQDKV